MKKSIVYTRTGDLGTTGLVGGERVKKSSLRVDTYGTVDELNSCIGVVASMSDITQDIRTELQWIQNKLFNLGSYLATNPGDEMTQAPGFGHDTVSRLEHEIDRMDESLPPLTERRIVELAETSWVDPDTLRFVNRLSDYLFILSRYLNISSNSAEIFWQKESK